MSYWETPHQEHIGPGTMSFKVTFDYGKEKGYFYIWPTHRNTWQWEALGNNGEEATQNKAMESAHKWIKYHVLNTDKGEE